MIKQILKRLYFLIKLIGNHHLFGGKWYQIKYILKYGEPDSYFRLYDFEHKSKQEQSEYVPYPVFRKQRNKLNQISYSFVKTAEHFDYLCLLRDKFYFGQLLKSLGYNTPNNKYIIFGKDKTILDLVVNKTVTIEEFLNRDSDSFCKITIGECGKGVFHLQIINKTILVNGVQVSLEKFMDIVSNGTFLVQDKITQHSKISAIYPKSVNTLRIITARKNNGECVWVSSCLRVGANGNNVDNWAKGGLIIGISDDGFLKSYGHYEFCVNGKWIENEHPDTHLCFKGYEVPFYRDAIDSVVNLHKLLYGIATIGWDVAITENGPCIIEGNDNYEISLNQVADKGLNGVWNDVYRTYTPQ